MKKNKFSFSLILIIVGAFAVIFAAGALIYTEVSQNNMHKKAVAAVATIKDTIPEVQVRVPEVRGNNMMPSLEIDEQNYIALLEIPKFNFELPVISSWKLGDVAAVPCRYSGSVYDNSLVIGSSDEDGQMSFVEELEVDDVLFITDMSGGKYEFSVETIQHSNNKISEMDFADSGFDLTLFVQSSGDSDFLLVRCNSDANVE